MVRWFGSKDVEARMGRGRCHDGCDMADIPLVFFFFSTPFLLFLFFFFIKEDFLSIFPLPLLLSFFSVRLFLVDE